MSRKSIRGTAVDWEPIKSNGVTFEAWLAELPAALATCVVNTVDEGSDYILQTGVECWREAYNDDLTPTDAASSEHDAACSMQ